MYELVTRVLKSVYLYHLAAIVVSAAIVGGIVAASFVIFAILIISIAVHCRR